MAVGSVQRLASCGTFLVLVSCAARTAAGGAVPVAKPSAAPKPRAQPVAPKPPSAYERRWQAACVSHGASDRCPAPFDRPGVFFDANGSGDYTPPSLCDVGTQTIEPATAAALQAERKALRACLRGVARGAFIDVVSDGSRPANAAADLSPRSVECVAKIVRRALPNTGPSSVKRVVVLNAGDTSKGEPTLTKGSVAAMITAHADEVGACYDGALEVWPGLRGKHAARVVVWFDGSVALVRTHESSLDNPALECCINTAVRGWHFGPPADGNIVIVTLPFVLGPQP